MARRIRLAGWVPAPFFCTAIVPRPEPPPPGPWDAVLILSPAGIEAIRPHLPNGTICFVTGPGTAEALTGSGLRPILPREPRAEGIWAELQARFPSGGSFLLVRGERSRAFLETAAESSPWRLTPWVSHEERPLEPLPPLPEVEGVLALSPLQAELMAPLSKGLLRLAWGQASFHAFASVRAPAAAWCEPTLEGLEAMLSTLPPPGREPI
jgi:uroporphyrinogen-III synthase